MRTFENKIGKERNLLRGLTSSQLRCGVWTQLNDKVACQIRIQVCNQMSYNVKLNMEI